MSFIAAPEMLQNRPYNELVDVWAAGILLYIMCVTPPFRSRSRFRLPQRPEQAH